MSSLCSRDASLCDAWTLGDMCLVIGGVRYCLVPHSSIATWDLSQGHPSGLLHEFDKFDLFGTIASNLILEVMGPVEK